MAATEKASLEIEKNPLERARQAARERGVEVPQLVHDALEHEIGSAVSQPADGSVEQPPLTFIGCSARVAET